MALDQATWLAAPRWSRDTGRVAPGSVSAHRLAALLPDLRTQPGARYVALAAAISALLLDGRVAEGHRLPSERALADALVLSRTTVASAYSVLVEQGLLDRRRGAGSYLRLPAGSRVGGPGARVYRPGAAAHDLIDLSVANLTAPRELLGAAAAAVNGPLGEFVGSSGYQPYGLLRLRELVAARYRKRGVPTDAEQILITSGAQHALDLVLGWRLEAGDRVLAELPTYPGALDAIRAHQGRIVSVPLTPAAEWDVAAMINAMAQTGPRLAYLIPDFHNPTGMLASEPARVAVAEAARRSSTMLVVDESFVELDLRCDPAVVAPPEMDLGSLRPMAAIDHRVISLGSLSKPLWGGIRVGWIRAAAETISQLAVIRARSDMSGSVIDQLVACQLLSDLDRIVAHRRTTLRASRDALFAGLAAELPDWRFTASAGGMSTWVELTAPVATGLSHQLEQRGVLLTPGSRFGSEGTMERFLRIPFSLQREVLMEAFGRIVAAWHELDLDRTVARGQRLIAV
jgi:DNA-binding transcriptional MocR family regulator